MREADTGKVPAPLPDGSKLVDYEKAWELYSALAGGLSLNEACARVGVAKKRAPELLDRYVYPEIRRALVDRAISHAEELSELVGKALEYYRGVLDDPEVSPRVKLAAASQIMETAARLGLLDINVGAPPDVQEQAGQQPSLTIHIETAMFSISPDGVVNAPSVLVGNVIEGEIGGDDNDSGESE